MRADHSERDIRAQLRACALNDIECEFQNALVLPVEQHSTSDAES